jgi:hypothetical protein
MKSTKKVFFHEFWLIFHWPLSDGSSTVFCSASSVGGEGHGVARPILPSTELKCKSILLNHCFTVSMSSLYPRSNAQPKQNVMTVGSYCDEECAARVMKKEGIRG